MNPFAALIQNSSSILPVEAKTNKSNDINDLYEQIFEITLNPFFQNDSKNSFVFLGQDSDHSEILCKENLDEVIYFNQKLIIYIYNLGFTATFDAK